MFDFFKKHKKKKEEKADDEILNEDRPQVASNGIYVGMYCEACGYMEVDESSSALPLEGFAVCPNCGALLKKGYFLKDADGGFSLTDHAEVIVEEKAKKSIVSGGHYRRRKAGPARLRIHGHFFYY